MATYYPTPSSTIKQRINKDVAVYLAEKSDISIDELLIAAATPAILADFKNIEQKSMYRVMLKMKLFLKSRQRFLNFTKDAIKEGLVKEWLPLLEDDDKVALLEEIAVIESISDNGVVTKREPQCTNFYKAKISELCYGNSDYISEQKHSSTPREPIKEIKPIANLAQILAPYIAWYKKWWKYMVKHEGYKWNATEQFQKVYNINAENLAENLKKALSLEGNLLSGHMNFSKDMLLKNTECSPQDIKSTLSMLFDESLDLAKRANDFIEQFNTIHEYNKSQGLLKANVTPHQNAHSISVYLAFAHPALHYIYKETVWLDFRYETELDYPPLSRFAHKLVGYEQICNHIREVLISDKELVDLHNKTYPNDKSDYHLLTQDFIYAIGSHFVGFDKHPADFEEGVDEK